MLFGASRLNARAQELQDEGQIEKAEAAYWAAIDADPDWSVPWYNLGLLYKNASQWERSLQCNARATALAPGDEAGWWNLGIAATALGHWDVARMAWKHCGLAIPDGAGPPERLFGDVPIRLRGAGEVVWATRIDPARAILNNIPLPRSGHRWSDVVLHDGAPNGYRVRKGQQVPVFDELARLTPSVFRTFVVEIDTLDDTAARLLEDAARSLGGAAEDWSRSTHVLCAKCSHGVVHHDHDTDHAPARPHCGVAARDSAHLQAILVGWLADAPPCRVVDWRDATADG